MHINDKISQFPLGTVFTIDFRPEDGEDNEPAPTIRTTAMLAWNGGDSGRILQLPDEDFIMLKHRGGIANIVQFSPVYVPWTPGDRVIVKGRVLPMTSVAPLLPERRSPDLHGTVAQGTIGQRALAGPYTTYVRIDGRDPKIYTYPEGFSSITLEPEPITPAALIVENETEAHA